MAEFAKSPKLRRRAGLERLASLLEELRGMGGLRERRPGTFLCGSHPFLHFHYHPDGTIVADIRFSEREGFERFDVSDADGQHEVLAMIEAHLGRRALPERAS